MRPAPVIAPAALLGSARERVRRVRVEELASRLATGAGKAAPGIVFGAVWTDGRRVVRAAGRADLRTGRPADPAAPFPWFSITKLFTATAVVQLAEQRRLALDAPVSSILPELRLERNGTEATVRHLLAHAAGLPNPIPVTWVHLAAEKGPGLEALLARRLGTTPRLRFEPGTRSAYSNLGYLVLGRVVERVAGERFEDYLCAHVLQPLGADETGFDAVRCGITGHQRRASLMGLAMRAMLDRRFLDGAVEGYWPLRPVAVDGAPYGGLIGPVEDLLALARMVLAGGAGARGRVLSAASVETMLTPTVDRDGRDLPVGLGFRIASEDGYRFVHHLGGGGGFRSELRIYPELGYAVAVVGSETSFPTEAFTRLLLARPGDAAVG